MWRWWLFRRRTQWVQQMLISFKNTWTHQNLTWIDWKVPWTFILDNFILDLQPLDGGTGSLTLCSLDLWIFGLFGSTSYNIINLYLNQFDIVWYDILACQYLIGFRWKLFAQSGLRIEKLRFKLMNKQCLHAYVIFVVGYLVHEEQVQWWPQICPPGI